MAVTANQVQNLYLAYFGRPAEQAGLTYWTAQTSATVDQISAAFAQQPEYTATYGNLTRAQTINTLYQNLFGRVAQSNELAYWNNSTDVSVSKLALALTNGATGTDRLTLDNKVQFATLVTTTQGTAGTVDAVKTGFNPTVVTTSPAGAANTSYAGVAAYVAAFTSTTVTAAQAAAQYYALANTGLQATVSPTLTGTGSTLGAGVDFKALTAGTITLNGANGTNDISLATTNKATSLSLTGTISAADASAITEVNGTKIVDTLNVNVSSTAASTAAATDKVLTLNVAGLTALKTIDASASSAGINLGTLDAQVSLTSVKTGAGADTLSINTTTGFTAGSTVTIDTGAGNDTVTATAGAASLNISTGDGVDTLTLTTGNSNLTVNAGAGNDLVTLKAVASTAGTTHVTTIDLGAGNDTLKVGTANTEFANLHNAANATTTNATLLAQDLIKVANFGTGDKLDLSSITDTFQALSTSGAANVAQASTLLAAATAAAADVNGTAAQLVAHTTTFQFGGNTYVLHADATAGVGANDGLIELTGFQGSFATTVGANGVYTAA